MPGDQWKKIYRKLRQGQQKRSDILFLDQGATGVGDRMSLYRTGLPSVRRNLASLTLVELNTFICPFPQRVNIATTSIRNANYVSNPGPFLWLKTRDPERKTSCQGI